MRGASHGSKRISRIIETKALQKKNVIEIKLVFSTTLRRRAHKPHEGNFITKAERKNENGH
ncbi:MAG: hypothetical protein DYH13_10565 [Alphaproteobacteria bacterium PRO2]|nr:hypothetical protein [Alphaproteobacteria bacterium PRO2]